MICDTIDSGLQHSIVQQIPDSCNQGIHCRPLVWTADGRPQSAATRTLQDAADIASSRNGNPMSAKSLQYRWKHGVQIALLRRRAAMTRAVLPNPPARAERLVAGIINRALSHWARAPPLDTGADTGIHRSRPDEDADTGVPDDLDDIASLASQPSTSPQHSSLWVYPSAPSGSSLLFLSVSGRSGT